MHKNNKKIMASEINVNKVTRIPLRECSNAFLEDLVMKLSCELYKYNYGDILHKIYVRALRYRVLAELTRRDELSRNNQ